MSGKYRAAAMALLLALGLSACGLSLGGGESEPDPAAGESSMRYLECMDTIMTLTAYGSGRDAALDAAAAELTRLDGLWSIGSEESEVARLNRDGGGALSEDTAAVLETALKLYKDTGGVFDVTVSPLMELWGFYSKDYRVPSESELDAARARVGADRLELDGKALSLTMDEGQAIDLGGIAKGCASQRITDLWRGMGLQSGLLSLGGNIQCLGSKPDGSPWRIGIRDPEDAAGIAAVAEVRDMAVISSGGYERFFTDEATGRKYQHILDPATGRPVESGLSSVSVFCADGALGDGLSTSLYIMGLEDGAEYWRGHSGEFEALFITDSGEIYITPGLSGCVSSQSELNVISG